MNRFSLFSSFPTKITTFTTNICEKTSILQTVMGFEPPTTFRKSVYSHNHQTRAPALLFLPHEPAPSHLPFILGCLHIVKRIEINQKTARAEAVTKKFENIVWKLLLTKIPLSVIFRMYVYFLGKANLSRCFRVILINKLPVLQDKTQVKRTDTKQVFTTTL